jgi:hypothetical protein
MKKNTSKYHIIFFSSLELNEFEAVVERVVWCLCFSQKKILFGIQVIRFMRRATIICMCNNMSQVLCKKCNANLPRRSDKLAI